MLYALTSKAANLWLDYQISKAKAYVIEALCKTNKLFHNRLQALEDTIVVLVKVISKELQIFKPRIVKNGHVEDLDMLDQALKDFKGKTKQNFQQKTFLLNNHHLALKLLAKTVAAYTKILRKYMKFYYTYSNVFKDFLSALDALSNVRLPHLMINPITA